MLDCIPRTAKAPLKGGGHSLAFGKPGLWHREAGLKAETLKIGRPLAQGAVGLSWGSNSEEGPDGLAGVVGGETLKREAGRPRRCGGEQRQQGGQIGRGSVVIYRHFNSEAPEGTRRAPRKKVGVHGRESSGRLGGSPKAEDGWGHPLRGEVREGSPQVLASPPAPTLGVPPDQTSPLHMVTPFLPSPRPPLGREEGRNEWEGEAPPVLLSVL